MSTSRSTSTLQKLQMFAASPESSQDFDPFNSNSSSLPMQACEELSTSCSQALHERPKELELKNGFSSICVDEIKRDATEVQCQSEISGLSFGNQSYIGENNQDEIQQIEQSVCNQISTDQVDQQSTNEYGEVPQPMYSSKATRMDNFDRKEILSKGPIVTAAKSPNNQMSDADAVIQMVTEVANDTSSAGDDRSNNQISRQFPGPAGILPRLHRGLESEPRLANLMRLHKGSDLRKYAIGKETRYKHISPKRIPDSRTPQEGDNRRCDRLEYIDNNELWQRMLDDDKLSSEGYHELMERFNIKFIKKSEDQLNEGGYEDFKSSNTYNSHVGYIAKTPLLIAAVKWIDVMTGHQDPTCQLIDKTGTIYGQFSSEIIEQYGSRIQPGTVLVLRHLSVLSTIRNVYVNITLANMIALFWLSPSTNKGLTKTAGIFGKRICRVTKTDILRDAKQIEDEARAEALAQEAALKDEMQSSSCRATSSGKITSPTSSTSSLPSSIRTPISNQQPYRTNYNGRNNYHKIHNPIQDALRPNFVPAITSSPAPAFDMQMRHRYPTTTTNNFYGQSSWRQPNPNRPTLIPTSDWSLKPKFSLNHSSNGRSFDDKENSEVRMLSPESTKMYKYALDGADSNLLEGLDEQSLFGDF